MGCAFSRLVIGWTEARPMAQTVEISCGAPGAIISDSSNSDFVVPMAREIELRAGSTLQAQAYVSTGQSPGTQFVQITAQNGTGSILVNFGSYVRTMTPAPGNYALEFTMNEANAWKYLFYAAGSSTPNGALVSQTVTVAITPGTYSTSALTDEINRQWNVTRAQAVETGLSGIPGPLLYQTTAVINPFQALVSSTTAPSSQTTRAITTYDGTTTAAYYEYASDGNRSDTRGFVAGDEPRVPYIVGADSPTIEFNPATNKYEITNLHSPCLDADGTRSIVVWSNTQPSSPQPFTSFFPCGSFAACRFYEPAGGGLWSTLGLQPLLNTPAQIAVTAANSSLVASVNYATTTSQFFASVQNSAPVIGTAGLRWPFMPAFLGQSGNVEVYYDFNSTRIISSNVPIFGNSAFFAVLSDILTPDESFYHASSIRDILPVVTIAVGGYQSPGGFSLGILGGAASATIRKTRVVRSIRVRITNSDGSTPQLNPSTSIIFNIFPPQ